MDDSEKRKKEEMNEGDELDRTMNLTVRIGRKTDGQSSEITESDDFVRPTAVPLSTKKGKVQSSHKKE